MQGEVLFSILQKTRDKDKKSAAADVMMASAAALSVIYILFPRLELRISAPHPGSAA
ncbi:MAG: hypothetical protein J6J71_08920 [Prevotella sp.]|nr:hypothetical protein [Prevotella sp.]